MEIKISDMKVFFEIQKKFDSVTPEMLKKLKGGWPIPDTATVIGELTPALKTLLCLLHDLADQATSAATRMQSNSNNLSDQEIKNIRAEHKKLVEEAQYLSNLFWAALNSEFPQTNGMSLGYGPKFEVYTYPSASSTAEVSVAESIRSMFDGAIQASKHMSGRRD